MLEEQANLDRVRFDQLPCRLEVSRRQGVVYCLRNEAVALVSMAGQAMQVPGPVGRSLMKAAAQHVGEQMVIALPPPFGVEGNHEQVRLLQMRQERLAILATSDCVTERTRESVEDRCIE
jgi:hypothetical protein